MKNNIIKTKLLLCIIFFGINDYTQAQEMEASPQGNAMFLNLEAQKAGDNTSFNNGNVYINLNRSNDQDQTLIRFDQNYNSVQNTQIQVTAAWELGMSNGDEFGVYLNNPNYTNPYFPALTISPYNSFVGIGTDQHTARLTVLNTLYGATGVESKSQGTAVYAESTGIPYVAGYGVHGVGLHKAGIYGNSAESHGVYGDISEHPEESNGTAGVYGVAKHSGNYGVHGVNDQGVGVYGTGMIYGVFGIADAIGVHGITKSLLSNTFGVRGEAIEGIGIRAWSKNNHGLSAYSGGTNSYAGYFEGDVFTTAAYLPSDRKLKHSITMITDALGLINKMEPKTYGYNHEEFPGMKLPEGQRYGFIAQKIKEVFPQLTKTTIHNLNNDMEMDQPNEYVEFEAVNYVELIPILVKAIQELNQEVEELKMTNDQFIHNMNATNRMNN